MALTEITFKITNLLAGLTWIILILSSSSSTPTAWIARGWVSTAFSLVYFASLVGGLEGFQNGGGFSTITEVRALFQNDWLLLAGWVHYLAFDLLIGARIAKDLDRAPWLIRAVCLVLTFLFGPIGWLFSRLIKPKQESV